MTNISNHPCANKCTEFKEEQCNHCLVIEDMGDDKDLNVRISPNCKVIGDESRHLCRALSAQGEIS